MIVTALFWVTICACGDESGAMAARQQAKSIPVISESVEIKEHMATLNQAKKETRCMKAYLKDMQAQQQGIQPDWEQPELDTYLEQDRCEPYLVKLKR